MDIVLGPRQVTIPPSENKSNIDFCNVLKNKYEECLQTTVTSALVDCKDLNDLIINYKC